MDEKKEQIGNANTKNSSYGSVGAFNGLFPQDIANQAMSISNQLYPQLPEPDPWEAAFQFFAEMGRQASQPGATVLGSAVGSMQAPLDYLNAKKKEKAESDRARMQSTISLGTALKGKDPSLSAIAKLNADFKAGRITKEQFDAAFAKATNISDSKSGALSPLGKLSSDFKNGVITEEEYNAGVKKLTDLGDSDSGPKPLTELAKLYDDLSLAEEGSEEAINIQKQIEAIAKKGGFNKDIFGAEADLRKEWKKFETPYDEIEIKHQKLVSALERETGVGDMSAIFVYMKMLDPGSVVRESEFAQAQQTAGAFETIRVRMAQIAEGDKLSVDQRKEFLDLAEEFRNLSKFYVGQNRLDLGTIVANNPALKASNIFGSELAPPNFYLDTNVFRQANSLGFTMDEIWEAMTEPERNKWKQENGVL